MKALLVLLVACDAAKPPPPPPAIASVRDAGLDATAFVPPPPPIDAAPYRIPGSDARWQRDVRAYAETTSRMVAGWGTVRLDGETPIRYATLVPDWQRVGAPDRGAYLFEVALHHVVAVTFDHDGRTTTFGATVDATSTEPVAFTAKPDVAIFLVHGHHHGGENLRFGLRDNELVLFEYSYTDDVTDDSEKPIETKFPDDFACRPRCPDLARFRYYIGSQLAVSLPARTIAELVEPAPTPYSAEQLVEPDR